MSGTGSARIDSSVISSAASSDWASAARSKRHSYRGVAAAMRAAPESRGVLGHTRQAGEIRVSLRLVDAASSSRYDLIHEFPVSAAFELRHDGTHHFAQCLSHRPQWPSRTAAENFVGRHGGWEKSSRALISAVSVAAASGGPLSRNTSTDSRRFLDAAPQHLRRLVVRGSLVQLDSRFLISERIV